MVKCNFVSSLVSLANLPLTKANHMDGQAQVKRQGRDFPGGPVVETLPSNAGGTGSIPVGVLRSHMPHGQKTRT